jgi:DDE superfamily endonuclease
MEPRFQLRKDQLLADCQVPLTTFCSAVRRLEAFAQPFVATLPSPESRQYTGISLGGLLSDREHKNAKAIASRHDLDRQALQASLGASPWDYAPLIDELNRQGAHALGRSDAVLVFGPATFPKKGNASVGVQRPWCGRLGKVANCQVELFLGSGTDIEHVLVDFRLSLPAERARDKKRRTRCGVPKEARYRTRHELALARLDRHGVILPHGGISGDDARGRPAWFRQKLAARDARFWLAGPSNTSLRDREAEPPPYGGQGRRPQPPFQGVRAWCEALPAEAWTHWTVRDGEKDPLDVAVVVRAWSRRWSGGWWALRRCW